MRKQVIIYNTFTKEHTQISLNELEWTLVPGRASSKAPP